MALTKIRGRALIKDNSIPLSKLETNFLNGVDWDITNGNNDATITGVKDPVNDFDVANKEYVDAHTSVVDFDVVVTAELLLDADMQLANNGRYYTGTTIEVPIVDINGNLITVS